jgi:S-adenosylmethionine hydrolase
MQASQSVFILMVVATLISAGCVSKDKCDCHSAGSKAPAPQTLVLMTDFGLADGAVSAMKGVAREAAPGVAIFDLTHEIPPYNIWEASYRLSQTYKYWPAGTVFVAVIDPGVGSDRHSVAVKTKSGHLYVGPDNGITTFVEDEAGIESIVVIDESKQRLKGSEDSYTFHGRDLYAYVGARLAGGLVKLEELGAKGSVLIKLPYQKPEARGDEVRGTIPVLDSNYGNVWTNIPKSFFEEHLKDAKTIRVRIPKAGFDRVLPVEATFAGVPEGQPLLYFNSLLNVSLALNQSNFAKRFKVRSGGDWSIVLSRK